jgi:hypothetical protein
MSERIDIDIEDDIYDFCVKEAKKKNLTLNEYVCQQLKTDKAKKPTLLKRMQQKVKDFIWQKK